MSGVTARGAEGRTGSRMAQARIGHSGTGLWISTAGRGAHMGRPVSMPSWQPKVSVWAANGWPVSCAKPVSRGFTAERRYPPLARRNPAQSAAPDLVCREFTADGPDQIGVVDITYVPTTAGFLYLAAVIDVSSRRVVGWSMRDDMAAPPVTDAPDMAIATRRPDRVIHHSDRGGQTGFVAAKPALRCR